MARRTSPSKHRLSRSLHEPDGTHPKQAAGRARLCMSKAEQALVCV